MLGVAAYFSIGQFFKFVLTTMDGLVCPPPYQFIDDAIPLAETPVPCTLVFLFRSLLTSAHSVRVQDLTPPLPFLPSPIYDKDTPQGLQEQSELLASFGIAVAPGAGGSASGLQLGDEVRGGRKEE